VASAAILSRTVTILEVAHNGSGSIVPVDAITFHVMVFERESETISSRGRSDEIEVVVGRPVRE
jgi:hypothetical protein